MNAKGILMENDEGCEFLVPVGSILSGGIEPLFVKQRKGEQWVQAKFSLRRRMAMAALGILRIAEVAEQYGLARVEEVSLAKNVLSVDE